MNKLIIINILVFILFSFKSYSQEVLVINSKKLKCNDTIRVYSPKAISKNKDDPTIFLLHGWSGS